MILFSSPNKPLSYGSKGNVLRKQATETYKEEIDNLLRIFILRYYFKANIEFPRYDTVDSQANSGAAEPPKNWSENDTRQWLVAQAQDIIGREVVKSDVDLFEQGLDR